MRARRASSAAVRALGMAEAEVGRVRWIGQGLSRDAFTVEVNPGGEGRPRVLVALVPRRSQTVANRRGVECEARLLTFLAGLELAFRVPRLAVAVDDDGETILVCEPLEGLPVDLRAKRTFERPWEFVGSIAAAVHRVPADELGWLGGHPTRNAHGVALLEELSRLERAPDETVRRGLGWLRAHLPPDEPSSLVHGDLLGQNLRHYPGSPPGVLDWEYARLGDPAYDLAVVTRGVRKPFQVAGGRERLLEAYLAAAPDGGPPPPTESDVRFHEVALHLRWYETAQSGVPDVEPVQSVLARLRNLVR